MAVLTYACHPCRYELAVGWVHYPVFGGEYAARIHFACGHCGLSHFFNHPTPDAKAAGFLPHYHYGLERLPCRDDPNAAPRKEPVKSQDVFTCFADFICPGCRHQGLVITAETKAPCCPLCRQPLECMGDVAA